MKNNICEYKETRYNKCDEKFYHLKGKVEMYLISIYFDEVTEKRIRSYMRQIGKATSDFRYSTIPSTSKYNPYWPSRGRTGSKGSV